MDSAPTGRSTSAATEAADETVAASPAATTSPASSSSSSSSSPFVVGQQVWAAASDRPTADRFPATVVADNEDGGGGEDGGEEGEENGENGDDDEELITIEWVDGKRKQRARVPTRRVWASLPPRRRGGVKSVALAPSAPSAEAPSRRGRAASAKKMSKDSAAAAKGANEGTRRRRGGTNKRRGGKVSSGDVTDDSSPASPKDTSRSDWYRGGQTEEEFNASCKVGRVSLWIDPAFVYKTSNNEQCSDIAEKIGCGWKKIAALNRDGYGAIAKKSRFKEGTLLMVPETASRLDEDGILSDRPPEEGQTEEEFNASCVTGQVGVWMNRSFVYKTADDELCGDVADKVGCGWREIAAMNKDDYGTIKAKSRFSEGTLLMIPDTASNLLDDGTFADDSNDSTAPRAAKKRKISDSAAAPSTRGGSDASRIQRLEQHLAEKSELIEKKDEAYRVAMAQIDELKKENNFLKEKNFTLALQTEDSSEEEDAANVSPAVEDK